MITPEKQTIVDAIAISIVACVDTLATRLTQQDVVKLRTDTLNPDTWVCDWQPFASGEGMLCISVTHGPLAAFCPPGRAFFLADESHAAAVKAKLLQAIADFWGEFAAPHYYDDADDADDDTDDADDADDADDDAQMLAELADMPAPTQAAAMLGSWMVDAGFVRDALAGVTSTSDESLHVFVEALKQAPPVLRDAVRLLPDNNEPARFAWLLVLCHFQLWMQTGDECVAWLNALASDNDPARAALRDQLMALDSGRASAYRTGQAAT